MKDEFISFVNALMAANPEVTKELKTESVEAYLNALAGSKEHVKPVMTDNGKNILNYMKTLTIPMKSADIAAGMGVSSRSVSGAMRKLVTDGYVEKVGTNNPVYIITVKGTNFNTNN